MRRSDNLERLPAQCDVLVIGGGATGLGVAVDAAARGYSTVLLEARDFAQGTSSASTNLIHGGVRYLQQGNISLVRSALRERGILAQNAPHIVTELRLLLPAYVWWEKPFYGLGLALYDLFAGSRRFGPTRILDAKTAARLIPELRTQGLRGGVIFSDGQFNDARLALCLAKTADRLGAVLLNHAPVTGLIKENGRICGAVFTDRDTGQEHEVRAKAVVNAAGVFIDTIRRMDDPEVSDLLVASRGVHLVLPHSFLGGSTGILVPRTKDGRVCFVLPWEGRVLVGTTDTPVAEPTREPSPSEEEIDFLLETAADYLRTPPARKDVLSVFSGLRPLVKGSTQHTSALSRDHTVAVSEAGLVTIAGGKWTTYRHMAATAVDRAAHVAGLPQRPCPTETLKLDGAQTAGGRWAQFGVSDEVAGQYEERYPGILHPALPHTMGMVAYVIENELPLTLEDVLSRRLRALRLDAGAALEVAPQVAKLMAQLQGRDQAWMAEQVADFARVAREAMVRVPQADGRS